VANRTHRPCRVSSPVPHPRIARPALRRCIALRPPSSPCHSTCTRKPPLRHCSLRGGVLQVYSPISLLQAWADPQASLPRAVFRAARTSCRRPLFSVPPRSSPARSLPPPVVTTLQRRPHPPPLRHPRPLLLHWRPPRPRWEPCPAWRSCPSQHLHLELQRRPRQQQQRMAAAPPQVHWLHLRRR
jgi:hypothetical protein